MKIMQLDTKVTQELQMLRERIDKMTTELETYSNIDKLKLDADAKKKVYFVLVIYHICADDTLALTFIKNTFFGEIQIN